MSMKESSYYREYISRIPWKEGRIEYRKRASKLPAEGDGSDDGKLTTLPATWILRDLIESK